MKILSIPKGRFDGLKENWKIDSMAGFLVFLLAVPLGLAIAKASSFTTARGMLTALIVGFVVNMFLGGRLMIKVAATGLLTGCLAVVIVLDPRQVQETFAVKLACAALFLLAIIQFIFGILKFCYYNDFFPPSFVHGMLAVIGVIIFAKQFLFLLGVNVTLSNRLSPMSLYRKNAFFIRHADVEIVLIGLGSILIIFGLPALGGIFRDQPRRRLCRLINQIIEPTV